MNENGEIFDSRKKINSKYKRSSERILVKEFTPVNDKYFSGRVISVAGKNFIIKCLDQVVDFKEIECVASGTFYSNHDNSTILTVGDYVKFSIDTNFKSKLMGRIHSVETRSSWLSRKPLIGIREDVIASNAEFAGIICSCDEPFYNTRLIDRLIVASEIGNLKPFIIMNKTDLSDLKMVRQDMRIYKKLGYPVFFISLIKVDGLDELNKFLTGKEVILIGASGVGKSSLINFLMKDQIQKIAVISNKSNKGKHTTSHAKLFNISDELHIIDTPGIREFGIVKINKEELTLYFHEFLDFYEHCRFMPCTHTHEPGCEIKLAVENGKISQARYQSYLNIFDSI